MFFLTVQIANGPLRSFQDLWEDSCNKQFGKVTAISRLYPRKTFGNHVSKSHFKSSRLQCENSEFETDRLADT